MKSNCFRFLIAMFIAIGITIPLAAQEGTKDAVKPAAKKDDSAERIREINKEITAKRAEILPKIRKAKPGSPEYTELLTEYYGVADEFADEIIELAGDNPSNRVAATLMSGLMRSQNKEVVTKVTDAMLASAKADPTSRKSFATLMTLMSSPNRKAAAEATELLLAGVKEDPKSNNSFSVLMSLMNSRTLKPMTKAEATELLLANFGDSEKMADLAMGMTRGPISTGNVKLLERLLDESEFDSVKAATSFALGKHFSANAGTKDKGMKLLKSIVEKYPDVIVGRTNLAKTVEGEIFEAENLQIGMKVPDIIGEDVDGVEFKLSDYKGKVVVIDFWGDW